MFEYVLNKKSYRKILNLMKYSLEITDHVQPHLQDIEVGIRKNSLKKEGITDQITVETLFRDFNFQNDFLNGWK